MLILPPLEPELMRILLSVAQRAVALNLLSSARMKPYELLIKTDPRAAQSLPWTCILRPCH